MIPLLAGILLAAACGEQVKVEQHADAGAGHASAVCSPLAFTTNPPSSGTHYGAWAAYKTYAARVPAGFLVHSLEHGAVVIGYNCFEGCDDEVKAVQAWIDGLGADPLCPGDRPKIILAPNAELDVRWAAAAWTWTWKAPCADTASLGAFFRAHYGKTVEAGVCGGGVDLSAAGWCPTALPRPTRGNPQATSGARLLWEGSLPARTRLLLEASAADGSRLGVLDLGGAGPGPARALWDPAAAGNSWPGAACGEGARACLLRVRTAEGAFLSGSLWLP